MSGFGNNITGSTVNSSNNRFVNSGNTTVSHYYSGPKPKTAEEIATEYLQQFDVSLKIPFQRNRNFCGRGDIMGKLCDTLKPQDAGLVSERFADVSPKSVDVRTNCERKTFILYGLGGTGKSQIALEYAHRFSDYYTSIVWIDAEDVPGTNESAYKIVEQLVRHYQNKRQARPYEIANILGIQGSIESTGKLNSSAIKVAMEVVNTWLSDSKNQRWLLIINNNDKTTTASELAKLIPTCDWGSVIFTTRLQIQCSTEESIEVEGIGAKAGLELLLKKSGKKNVDDSEIGEAQKIVEASGQLPLALDQAGAYISSLRMSFSAYQKKLENGFTAGFKAGSNTNPDDPLGRSSVLTTWELSFQELPENARRLLQLCAFLSNEDIPEELFLYGKDAVDWIAEDEKNFSDAIESLFTFSLAKRKESSQSFYISKLVHAWSRERQDDKARRQNAKDTLKLVTAAISHFEDRYSSDSANFQRRILSHLNLCQQHILDYFRESYNSLTVARASYNIAFAYNVLGYYSEAESLYKRALGFWEKKWFGRSSSAILEILEMIAGVFFDEGRFDEALVWYRKALAGQRKSILFWKKDSAEILSVRHNMALVFTRQGLYVQALELYQKALTGKEKEYGKDDPETLTTVDNIASVYSNLGRFEEALEWHNRALTGMEKSRGKDHPDILTIVNNIGLVYKRQERYEEALEFYERALAGFENQLGGDHPSTLTILDSMASVFNSQGLFDKALEWHERALAGRESFLGKKHPSTLETVDNMGVVFNNQRLFDKALKCHQRALAGREELLGKDHPKTLDTVDNMAKVFSNLGQQDESLKLYKRALTGRKLKLGAKHPLTLQTAACLVKILENQGRQEEAAQYKEME
ncbi:hypothetical protein RUND412_007148 [Rhizina undulata]